MNAINELVPGIGSRFFLVVDYMKALQSTKEKSKIEEKEGLQHGHIFWMRRA